MIQLKKFPKIALNVENLFKIELNENVSFISSASSILSPVSRGYSSYKKISIKKKLGKFVTLIFFGLNYNAKRIKHFRKPWVIDLQKSHKIKIEQGRQSEIKTRVFKRRVIFFSYSRQELDILVTRLKKNRKQNSYSGHGLIEKDDQYKTKPGKIRQK